MLRNLLKTFTGEKKYFSFVILAIFIIFLSAVISPYLINRDKRNWNEKLPATVVEIENSSIDYLKVREADLFTKEAHLKSYVRENLEPQNFRICMLLARLLRAVLDYQAGYQNQRFILAVSWDMIFY